MFKKIIFLVAYSLILLSSFLVLNVNADSNDMKSKDYMINVSDLSPAEKNASNTATSPKDIINSILEKITQMLLIIIPSLASIFIVVWGIKMITSWWDSSKISSAKNIITYNIIAIVISLLSYSIIQLIVWLLWSTN